MRFRTILWLASVLVFVYAAPTMAQVNVDGNDRLGWTPMRDATTPATLDEANSFVYKYYLDSSATGVIITGFSCTATGPTVTCSVWFPQVSVGRHTLVITASAAGGDPSTESGKSSPPFDFVYGSEAPPVRIGTPVGVGVIKVPN